MNNRTEIPLNKYETKHYLKISLVFFCFGIYMIFQPYGFEGRFTTELIFGLGFMTIFGITAIFCLNSILRKDSGLIIDHLGISDYASYVKFGFIKWEDIMDIEFKYENDLSFLLIKLFNPEEYYAKSKLKDNMKYYDIEMGLFGTPIPIRYSSLNYNYRTLEKEILAGFKKYKKNK